MTKKKLTIFLGLAAALLVAAGVPTVMRTDTLKLGLPASTDNKYIEFDTADGASNVKLSVTNALGVTVNSDDIQFGDGASGDKEIRFNRGGSNPFIRWNETEDKLQFSDNGTDVKSFTSLAQSASLNLLADHNYDFENGVTSWTASAGTFVAETTNELFGLKSGSWDSSANLDTLTSATATLPIGQREGVCVASIYYKYDAGSNGDYTLQLLDGTNTVLEAYALPTTSGAGAQLAGVSDLCPASGSVKLRILSNANGNVLLLDNAFLGSLTQYGQHLTGALSVKRRDESSGATVNALSTSSGFVKLTATVTTINGASNGYDGKTLVIYNATGSPVTINHQSGSAAAADRFLLPGAAAMSLADDSAQAFVYDSNQSRWVLGGAAASSVTANSEPSLLANVAIAAGVAGNALTVQLKTSAGADPSAGDPVRIAFRDSTAANGTYNVRSVTGALSVTASSGSSLGTLDQSTNKIWVYAIDNAGTVELALSGSRFWDEGELQSTTAEGGAGAADGLLVMYSTTARANVPARLIGFVQSTQTTAGTWLTAPSIVSTVVTGLPKTNRSEVIVATGNGYGAVSTRIRRYSVTRRTVNAAITYADNANSGASFTINEAGIYGIWRSDRSTTTSCIIGITVNSGAGATAIDSIAVIPRYAMESSAGTEYISTSAIIDLQPGDVVRPHDSANCNVADDTAAFYIRKLTE